MLLTVRLLFQFFQIMDLNYTDEINDAGLILINTCSIRENAEQRIWSRLKAIRHLKKKNNRIVIGLIGCMAERLKEKVLETEQLVDIVVGPDAYRDLPVSCC